MWDILLAPTRVYHDLVDEEPEMREKICRDMISKVQGRVRKHHHALPWLQRQTSTFLTNLGELIKHGQPKKVIMAVRAQNLTQEDLSHAVSIMGHLAHCHALLPFLKEREVPWLRAGASLLKDMEESGETRGGVLTSYDSFMGAPENEASEKLMGFMHAQDFTLERMDALADCGFMTAQLQAILTYEHDQALCFTLNTLRELAPILKMSFLTKDHPRFGYGTRRLEETQAVLRFVQDKGLPAALNVARVVNALPTRGAKMKMFSKHFDFLRGLSMPQQTLLRRCLEARFRSDDAVEFVKQAISHGRDLAYLAGLGHVLLKHYVPRRGAFDLEKDEYKILERLTRGCPHDISCLLNRTVTDGMAGTYELGPIAEVDLPPHLRPAAVNARYWLLEEDGGDGSYAESVPSERLTLFQNLMEGYGAKSALDLSHHLRGWQITHHVKDIADARVPLKWREKVLDSYIGASFDARYLPPLARGLDRMDLSDFDLSGLLYALEGNPFIPEAFAQVMDVPLDLGKEEMRELVVNSQLWCSPVVWELFLEALKKVHHLAPRDVLAFIKRSGLLFCEEDVAEWESFRDGFIQDRM